MTLVKFGNGVRRPAFNPLFTDVIDSVFRDSSLPDRFAAKVPAVNVSETEHLYLVELAAPGLKKEDFKVSVDKDLLVISSEKKEEQTEEGKTYNRREYSYSSFSRSFNLPEQADQSAIEAEYTDGVLKVTIGKKEEARPATKEIAIK